VELANEYPNDPIYAAIGLYPAHISETEYDEEKKAAQNGENFFDEEKYQKLIDEDKNKKIVAMGEFGLEYSFVPPGRDFEEIKNRQKDGLIKQLNFAAKNNLPVALHLRGSKSNPNDAFEDALEILKNFVSFQRKLESRKAVPGSRVSARDDNNSLFGVIHCFTSDRIIAQKFLDLGFYLGFTGIITFKNKNVDEIREVVKLAPLDRILVETDAPYLSPEPHRGEKNTPRNVEFVARQAASLKGVDFEEVCERTTENFKQLFRV
jgi:TatD DNase family protein